MTFGMQMVSFREGEVIFSRYTEWLVIFSGYKDREEWLLIVSEKLYSSPISMPIVETSSDTKQVKVMCVCKVLFITLCQDDVHWLSLCLFGCYKDRMARC